MTNALILESRGGGRRRSSEWILKYGLSVRLYNSNYQQLNSASSLIRSPLGKKKSHFEYLSIVSQWTNKKQEEAKGRNALVYADTRVFVRVYLSDEFPNHLRLDLITELSFYNYCIVYIFFCITFVIISDGRPMSIQQVATGFHLVLVFRDSTILHYGREKKMIIRGTKKERIPPWIVQVDGYQKKGSF